MGIIARIRNALSAKVNELLDNIEDPEAKIDRIIRDMEGSVIQMRKTTASAIATARLTQEGLQRTRREARTWERNAEEAVLKDEDLARKALLRKMALEQRAAFLKGQVAEANTLASRMKDTLTSTELKMQEIRARRDVLISKKRSAEARGRMNEAFAQFAREVGQTVAATDGLLEGLDQFSRLEDEIQRISAEAEAEEELSGGDLEREFEKMRQQRKLDEELAALKKRVKD